jgi:hypothetical protein
MKLCLTLLLILSQSFTIAHGKAPIYDKSIQPSKSECPEGPEHNPEAVIKSVIGSQNYKELTESTGDNWYYSPSDSDRIVIIVDAFSTKTCQFIFKDSIEVENPDQVEIQEECSVCYFSED